MDGLPRRPSAVAGGAGHSDAANAPRVQFRPLFLVYCTSGSGRSVRSMRHDFGQVSHRRREDQR
jgi:hypothetical protein